MRRLVSPTPAWVVPCRRHGERRSRIVGHGVPDPQGALAKFSRNAHGALALDR